MSSATRPRMSSTAVDRRPVHARLRASLLTMGAVGDRFGRKGALHAVLSFSRGVAERSAPTRAGSVFGRKSTPATESNPKRSNPMAEPAVAWFEITGQDGPALQKFYGELFDWRVQDAGGGYGTVAAGPKGIGGGIGQGQGGPGQATLYVAVEGPAAC